MSFAILGLGTAAPPYRYAQAQTAEAARALSCDTEEQAHALATLYRQTRIEHRHMVFGPEVFADVLNGTAHSGSSFASKGTDERGPDTVERMALYEKEALPLAASASRKALLASGVAAG